MNYYFVSIVNFQNTLGLYLLFSFTTALLSVWAIYVFSFIIFFFWAF